MDELVYLMASVDAKVSECIKQYIQLHEDGLLSATDTLLKIDKCLTIARIKNREQLLFDYPKML